MSADEAGLDKHRNGIQVIGRAAAILRTLKDHQLGLSLGQIAREVNLPRSTVQRIVAALYQERLVISEADGRGIRLGPELIALAQATRYNTAETCRPYLEELANATGETVDLSVLRKSIMIFLDQVPGTHRLRTISSIGETFPLTTTANGRACLANMPRQQAEKLIAQEWKSRGISKEAGSLNEILDEISKTGFAIDLDEHTKGISAIGFSFTDMTGDLLAISVPVPTSRFNDKRLEIETAIKQTASQIKAEFG